MSVWIEHNSTYYNLDKFTQIWLKDQDEILLVNISHNMKWVDQEDKICCLKFKSEQERDEFYQMIRNKLRIGK
jgi:N6-adenosine-specific RNA methylase IME4